jgi:hypothetical protein
MAIEKNIKINVDTKEAVTDVSKLDKSFKKLDNQTQKTSTGLKDVGDNGGAIAVLDSVTGGLATRFRDAFEATKLFNFSLKGTRTALIATGVGAFVVLLGLVVAYWDDIKDAISGVNREIERQGVLIDQNLALLDSELGLIDAQIKLGIQRGGNVDDLITKQKELNIEKRKELVLSIGNLNAELLQAKAAQERFDIQKFITGGRFTQTDERKAATKELETQLNAAKELLAEFDIKVDLIENPKTPTVIPEKAKKEKEEDEKIVFDDTIQKRLEAETEALEGIARIRQEFADKNRDSEEAQAEIDRERKLLEIEELIADEVFKREAIAEVNKYYDDLDAKIKADKLISDEKIEKEFKDIQIKYKQDVKDASIQLASSTIGAIGALANEGSLLAKGAAVAQATMNTFQGITKALAETTDPTPTQSLRFGNAIAVGVMGLANVANILKTKPIETSVPSAGTGGGRAPAPPSFNLVSGTASNQISDSLQLQAPVRAIVVSRDVTSAQEANRNSENNSTL